MISRQMLTCSPIAGMRIMLILVTGLTSMLVNAKKSPQQSCAREDAIKAETEASSLKTWNALYESYGRYHQCDDGAISEGYSNSVATLLADHWDNADSLTALAKKDPKFKAFVLHHVDALMTSTQAKRIRENVQSRCPANAKNLCQSIAKRL